AGGSRCCCSHEWSHAFRCVECAVERSVEIIEQVLRLGWGGAEDADPVPADISDEGKCGECAEGAERKGSEWSLSDAPFVEEVVVEAEEPLQGAREDRDPGSEK